MCIHTGVADDIQHKDNNDFVIGDSTAAEKGGFRNNPERGWGMVLQGFFDDKVIVDNHAVNGRSSLSFINEGRWKRFWIE